jgi:hypothetical protein
VAETVSLPSIPLMGSETPPGTAENNEGIGSYKEGHWDVLEKHSRKVTCPPKPSPDVVLGFGPIDPC